MHAFTVKLRSVGILLSSAVLPSHVSASVDEVQLNSETDQESGFRSSAAAQSRASPCVVRDRSCRSVGRGAGQRSCKSAAMPTGGSSRWSAVWTDQVVTQSAWARATQHEDLHEGEGS
jgi:hypothetical protein